MFGHQPNNKKIAPIILASFLLVLVSSSLVVKSAQAQLGAASDANAPITATNTFWTATNTASLLARDVAKEVQGNAWQYLKLAGAMGIHTAVANFAQQASMDLADYVATSGSGQKPLAFTQGWGPWMTNLGLQAAADAIGGLSNWTEVYGFSLCEPNANFKFGFILPVIQARFQPPKHKCNWQKLVANWENFGQKFGSDKELLENVALSLSPSSTDWGVFMSVNDKLTVKAQDKLLAKAEDRKEGEGWQAVKDVVTGNVKTPAQLVKAEVESTTRNTKDIQANTVSNAYLSSIATPEFWISSAVSPFVNTLVSKLTQRLLQKGLLALVPDEQINLGNYGPGDNGLGQTNRPITSSGAQTIADLSLIDLPSMPSTFDPLSEMVSCPPKPVRQPNNCVIDNKLYSLLRLTQEGKSVSIACAMDASCAGQEFLHGDWQILGPEKQRAEDQFCSNGAYCYSNLVKLRQLRILPLGFEIAAIQSGRQLLSYLNPLRFASINTGQMLRLAQAANIPTWQPISNQLNLFLAPSLLKGLGGIKDRPVRLREVINDFNNPASLYYHLIDPNWIIKMPKAQCLAETYGSTLIAQGSSDRAKSCVDMQTCLAEDSSGNCQSWGYCLREKNIWKFPGESCLPQYASCLTLNSGQGKPVSYLWDTMERCTMESAGCRWYSTRLEPVNNKWLDSSTRWEEGNRLYFKKGEQCPKEQEGCSQFKVAGSPDEYFKEAPDYYNCGGYTQEREAGNRYALSNPDHVDNCTADQHLWRDDIQRCVGLSGTGKTPSSECARFARYCQATEAGCLSYKPVTFSGPDVPGKITPRNGDIWYDECPSECVGYSKYTAQPQFWDIKLTGKVANPYVTSYAYNFIPNKAEQCTATDVGCTEFTNLAAGTTGEQKFYYKQWKNCILPGPNTATFFTWEGTDTKGYQLKAWSLKKHTSGGPELQDSTVADSECTASIYKLKLGQVGYNADCREYFDALGKKYYASAKKTITSSPDCQTLRKTAVDENNDLVVDSKDCPIGAIKDGSCLVSLIPTEARTCSVAVAGCREYMGSAASNIKTVLQDDFELPSTQPSVSSWRVQNGAVNDAPAEISNSAMHVGNYSISGWALNTGLVYFSKSFNNNKSVVPLANTSGVIRAGQSYELVLVARTESSNATIEARFSAGTIPTEIFSIVSSVTASSDKNLSTQWKTYRLLGQAPADWLDLSMVDLRLEFNTSIGNKIYIDNIILREVSKGIYVKQGTWQIDNSCYNMFGCAAYKQGTSTVNLRSFTSLCRQEAIGCKEYTKTYNYTATDQGVKFNQADDPRGPTYNNDSKGDAYKADNITLAAHQDVYRVVPTNTSCTAANKGCQALGQPVSVGAPLNSTLQIRTVGADDISVGYCYLGATCTDTNGCDCETADETIKTKLAKTCKVEYNQSRCLLPMDTVYLKNNPDFYIGGQTLCQVQEDRCTAFSFTDGNKQVVDRYAKQPYQQVCEWKENVLFDGVTQSGWFIKNSNPLAICLGSGSLQDIATITDVAPGGIANYRGFVGECKPEQHLCTRFIDPRSPSTPYFVISNTELDSSSCAGLVSEREGCIPFVDKSIQDKDGNVKLTYQSDLSYKESMAKNYQGVRAVDCTLVNNKTKDSRCEVLSGNTVPKYCTTNSKTARQAATCSNKDENGDDVTCETPTGCPCQATSDDQVTCVVAVGEKVCSGVVPGQVGAACNINTDCPARPPWLSNSKSTTTCKEIKNDANVILKVTRDRACGQWLSCRSATIVDDPRTGTPRKVCNKYDLCSQLAPDGICADGKFVTSDKRPGFLDLETYKTRFNNDLDEGISWDNQDFSGQSLYLFNEKTKTQGAYQPYDLQQVNLGDAANPDYRLVYVLPNNTACASLNKGSVCGTDPNGRCYAGQCVYGVDGRAVDLDDAETALVSSCRGFPEANSPFRNDLADATNKNRPNGFDQVNLCEPDQGENCQCNYKKATYKGGINRYYDHLNSPAPGVCQGGYKDTAGTPADGEPCGDDTGCWDKRHLDSAGKPTAEAENGKCMLQEKAQQFLGWQGYCLQKDLLAPLAPINGVTDEFACASWLPLDQAAGGYDLYNQYANAGFVPPSGPIYYCSVKQSNSNVFSAGAFYNHRPPTGGSGVYSASSIPAHRLFHNSNGTMEEQLGSGYTLLGQGTLGYGGWPNRSMVMRFDLDSSLIVRNASGQDIAFGEVNFLNLSEIDIEISGGESSNTWPAAGTILKLEANNNWQDAWCGAKKTDKAVACNTLNSLGILGNYSQDSRGIFNWRSTGVSANEDFFQDVGSPPTNYKVNDLGRYVDEGGSVCNSHDSDDEDSNLLAVKARFSPTTGKFLGFYSGVCVGSGDKGQVFVQKITFKLRNACEAVEQVSDTNGDSSGYTDRLTDNAQFRLGIGNYFYTFSGTEYTPKDSPTATGESARAPYNSINVLSGYPINWAPIIVANNPSAGRVKRGMSCYVNINGSCGDQTDKNNVVASRTEGKNSIFSNLFARLFGGWQWQNGSYTSSNSAPSSVISSSNGAGPWVGQVQKRYNDRLGQLGAITVGDQIDGRISGRRSLDTSISFYAWADRNRMPLRSITVDFGDGPQGLIAPSSGKYKNTKPYCSNSDVDNESVKVCSGTNLNITCKENIDCTVVAPGASCEDSLIDRAWDSATPSGLWVPTTYNSKGNRLQACSDKFREYTHTYSCDFSKIIGASALPDCTASSHPNGCKTTGTDGKKYCVYKPRVQVKDNWGWCNSGSSSVYGDLPTTPVCGLAAQGQGSYYPGEIWISAN